MIVSPTEPAELRAAADSVSMSPENYGADVMWFANKRRVGVQRKELKDLLSSVQDKRLGEQLNKMQALDTAVVLIEGKIRYTLDGLLMEGVWQGNKGTRGRGREGREGQEWTRRQVQGVLWSVRSRGVWVDYTDGLQETIDWLRLFKAWTRKTKHTGLEGREKVAGAWGTPDNADYARHLLMGLPGIGYELAERMQQTLGVGRVLKLGVTRDELLTVEGLGPKKADAIMRALGGNDE